MRKKISSKSEFNKSMKIVFYYHFLLEIFAFMLVLLGKVLTKFSWHLWV